MHNSLVLEYSKHSSESWRQLREPHRLLLSRQSSPGDTTEKRVDGHYSDSALRGKSCLLTENGQARMRTVPAQPQYSLEPATNHPNKREFNEGSALSSRAAKTSLPLWTLLPPTCQHTLHPILVFIQLTSNLTKNMRETENLFDKAQPLLPGISLGAPVIHRGRQCSHHQRLSQSHPHSKIPCIRDRVTGLINIIHIPLHAISIFWWQYRKSVCVCSKNSLQKCSLPSMRVQQRATREI
jgi:hypothetical protein